MSISLYYFVSHQVEFSSKQVVLITPTISPDEFENIKGSKAKRHKATGEVWEPDLLHRDHWEVYKDLKNWERGKRDQAVWNDGRPKEKFQ